MILTVGIVCVFIISLKEDRMRIKKLLSLMVVLLAIGCGKGDGSGTTVFSDLPKNPDQNIDPSLGTPTIPNVVAPVPVVSVSPSPTPSPSPVALHCYGSGNQIDLAGTMVYDIYCTGGNLGSTLVTLDMQKMVTGNWLGAYFAVRSVTITNAASQVCLSGTYSITNPVSNSSLSFSSKCASTVQMNNPMHPSEGLF